MLIENTGPAPSDLSPSELTFTAKVRSGVAGFFTDNIGIRGDVRYFRSLEDIESDVEDLDLDVSLGDLRFWRGTVGVTFRF